MGWVVVIAVAVVVTLAGKVSSEFGVHGRQAYWVILTLLAVLATVSLIVEYRIELAIKQIRKIVEGIEAASKKEG